MNSNSKVKKTKHHKTSKFREFMDDWDYYATPITLSFNKKDKFSTIPGFICSILSLIIIVLYFYLRIGSFTALDSYTTTNSIIFNGVGHNGNLFTIKNTDVTLAYKIGSTDTVVAAAIDTYV